MLKKRLIQEIKRRDDWILQKLVGAPFFCWYPAYAYVKLLEDLTGGYGPKLNLAVFRKAGEESIWVEPRTDVHQAAEYYYRHLRQLEAIFNKWRQARRAYYKFISRLTPADIAAKYPQFEKLYLDNWAAAVITEHFLEPNDKFIKDLQKRYPALDGKILAAAIAPEQTTFFGQYQLDRHQFALQREEKAGAEMLARRYYWLENNYKYVKILAPRHFAKEIKEIIQSKSAPEIRKFIIEFKNRKRNRARALSTLGKVLKPRDVALIKWLGRLAWWQDERKKANLIGNHWIDLYLRYLSKKTGIPLSHLRFALPAELSLLSTNKFKKELEQRHNSTLIHIMDSRGREVFLKGGEAERIIAKLIPAPIITAELSGTVANPGVVRGRVQIVLNPKAKIKYNNFILVTSMTRPEFLPLLKKAAAIVTDEGGITSHAAIISRELGIPAIIGTRVATQVLRDGDKVEIDASRGVVNKIN